jgi:hypothetical protein
MPHSAWPYAPAAGALFAIALLALVEAALHSDAFLYRYRSVFAVGRAMDKLRYVESHVPLLVIVGNSRVDNAFDPVTLQANLHGMRPGQVFNLGMPGADARALHGALVRLASQDLLGPRRISKVVIGLDEGFLQAGDSLGYAVFFANRTAMWREREYVDLARSWLRLWGYSDNLKELREPAKLERFAAATLRDLEPIGGAADAHFGYRAGFGGLQDAGQAVLQEAGSQQPPDPRLVRYFWRCLELLSSHGVDVVIAFPPLLNREVLYISPSEPRAAPYLRIANELAARGIPVIALDPGGARSPDEFVNAGHLNDRGAQRFTRLLAKELGRAWSHTRLGERQ